MPDGEHGGARQRIFLAAVRVFAAKGYKGATVRDICREAGGANLNAINYYFGGKEKLYQAILEVLFTEGDRQLRERLAEAGPVSPEERLRLLLEVCCRMFFAGGEVNAAFIRLWLMELANPTPFLDDMVECHSRPQVEDMLATVAAIVGPGAPREVLIDSMMSILGPMVYQALIWPAVGPLFPEHPGMETYWPRLVDHLYRFAMAGLAAMREALVEKEHATGRIPG
jgi:AcrR family transcriptional regulator